MYILLLDPSIENASDLDDRIADLAPECHLVATNDAEDAISLLGARRFGAVVARIGRNAQGGTDLLRAVQSGAPQALRIAVVDDDSVARATATLDLAHRLVLQPLRANWLIQTLRHGDRLTRLLDNPELIRRIGAVGRLPGPPGLYLSLIEAIERGASATTIGGLIRHDPGIAAALMQLGNSAIYARGKAIDDLDTAIVRLGLDTICRLVLASQVHGTGALTAERRRMQEQALFASRLAQKILAAQPPRAQQAATAAVLADVGLLLPLGNAAQADIGDADTPPLCSRAGAYLLGLWGLPDPIVEAVAFRHCPLLAPERGFGLAGAVHVACALAAGADPDSDYLDSVGVLERLPAWQSARDDLAALMDPPAPVITSSAA